MKKKKWWWITGGILGLIILLIAFGKGGKDQGVKVSVEKVAKHTIVETVTASGKIYPETEVKISPEVSGEIVDLTIQEGDSVRKGQLLARINSSIYRSQVTQAQASVQQSRSGVNYNREMSQQMKAQFDQARSAYNRNKQLYKDKVISAQEFEQAEATFRSAQASYEGSLANISGGTYGIRASQENLTQARENLRRTAIIAPTNGIISSLKVKQGERVVGTAQMAGTEILTIADLGRIEVRVDVGETDIAKVKMGDTALIEADAYRNRKFTGIVSKVAVSSTASAMAANTDQVTNYTVHILILPDSYSDLLRNGSFPFKPGMSASVDIITRKDVDVLSVPVNAVTTRDWPDSIRNLPNFATSFDEIRQVVFVYDPAKKTVTYRNVKTGIQDNLNISILQGLSFGDEVVVAPYGAIARTLNDNDKVRVVKKELLFESSDDKKQSD